MSKVVRIGTRGSQLALWQANETGRLLTAAGYQPEIVTIKTTGDKRTDVPLASIGGKGLFIKELEDALDGGAIDVAVHSVKDVPSIIPERFVLAGFLKRADPRDAWLHPQRIPLRGVAEGSVIGTSSPRRRAQLLGLFPHLVIEPIRGNVDTRIHKMNAGMYAGIVLANAGITRLGREAEITSLFDVEEMVPAAGQGIVGIETLKTNTYGRDAAAAITHDASALAARCERGVLLKFGQRLDCYSCIAVHATAAGDGITIRTFLSDYEGLTPLRVTRKGTDPDAVIDAVADELIARGAIELLRMKAT
jgi:hydroxymethylbilane synthase